MHVKPNEPTTNKHKKTFYIYHFYFSPTQILFFVFFIKYMLISLFLFANHETFLFLSKTIFRKEKKTKQLSLPQNQFLCSFFLGGRHMLMHYFGIHISVNIFRILRILMLYIIFFFHNPNLVNN